VRTHVRHCRAVSLHCVVALTTQHPRTAILHGRPSSNRLSVAALVLSRLTMATVDLPWSVFQPTLFVDFSQYRMQRHSSYSGSVVPTTSVMCLLRPVTTVGKDCFQGRRAVQTYWTLHDDVPLYTFSSSRAPLTYRLDSDWSSTT